LYSRAYSYIICSLSLAATNTPIRLQTRSALFLLQSRLHMLTQSGAQETKKTCQHIPRHFTFERSVLQENQRRTPDHIPATVDGAADFGWRHERLEDEAASGVGGRGDERLHPLLGHPHQVGPRDAILQPAERRRAGQRVLLLLAGLELAVGQGCQQRVIPACAYTQTGRSVW
jgi:hypothetical protein